MKKLIFSILAFAGLSLSLVAQEHTDVFNLTNNSPYTLISAAKVVSNISVINNSTNVNIIRFYDSTAQATNYVQAAYTSYSSYATNYSIVFTNQTGVLVTNTFSGTYTGPTSHSASTNTLTAFYSLGVPGSGSASKDVRLLPMRGLTALSTGDAVITVTYTSD